MVVFMVQAIPFSVSLVMEVDSVHHPQCTE